jgi:hypothetical protein
VPRAVSWSCSRRWCGGPGLRRRRLGHGLTFSPVSTLWAIADLPIAALIGQPITQPSRKRCGSSRIGAVHPGRQGRRTPSGRHRVGGRRVHPPGQPRRRPRRAHPPVPDRASGRVGRRWRTAGYVGRDPDPTHPHSVEALSRHGVHIGRMVPPVSAVSMIREINSSPTGNR